MNLKPTHTHLNLFAAGSHANSTRSTQPINELDPPIPWKRGVWDGSTANSVLSREGRADRQHLFSPSIGIVETWRIACWNRFLKTLRGKEKKIAHPTINVSTVEVSSDEILKLHSM
ncbi:hypothetical protein TNCV_4990821 [Trichonephila clavipes]|nr:hypothetical protein TNCV_4990821 [Trichonephila clavipes]